MRYQFHDPDDAEPDLTTRNSCPACVPGTGMGSLCTVFGSTTGDSQQPCLSSKGNWQTLSHFTQADVSRGGRRLPEHGDGDYRWLTRSPPTRCATCACCCPVPRRSQATACPSARERRKKAMGGRCHLACYRGESCAPVFPRLRSGSWTTCAASTPPCASWSGRTSRAPPSPWPASATPALYLAFVCVLGCPRRPHGAPLQHPRRRALVLHL